MRKPREIPDTEKTHPRYDDHRHIDSGAIDPPAPKPAENYTAEYLVSAETRPTAPANVAGLETDYLASGRPEMRPTAPTHPTQPGKPEKPKNP